MADTSSSSNGPNPGNRLGRSASPYLLQHANNPVDWRPWGPEALAEAKAANKPILLSIGYAACHWCHVMAHESFEDPTTAAVMNRLFVNIKVDREERPDIDQIYMQALQALGEQGGWPLTMFLTPDAEPVWGGTYFPKEAKWGRPSFVDVLTSAAAAFRDRPDMVEANRSGLLESLKALPDRGAGAELGPAFLDEAAATVVRVFDPVRGGLRGAPKFPQPTLLEFLARASDRSGRPEPAATAVLSLRNMVQGGIYDHVGGGLSRYSVDDQWLVPHFEKMLYDNALLLERLSDAWLRTGDPLFRLRIEETTDWLFREMATEGAFAASLDADSPGGEGAFYVWRPAEIEAVLGREPAREFCAIYDITDAGNFEGASIPNRLRSLTLSDPATETRLASYRRALRDVRDRRPRPARDDKILADWNGLAIAGLARAGAALGRTDLIDRAAATYRFVTESMTTDGRLSHARRGESRVNVGFATDYAALIRAALSLQSATGEGGYIEDAVRLTAVLDRHYWDDAAAAYRLTADDAEALISRPVPLHDESIPGANALIAASLSRLTTLTGEGRFAERADTILAAHCASASQVLGKAGLFNALDQRLGAVEIVVVAASGAAADALLQVIRQNWREAHVLSLVSTTAGLPSTHPAHGKTAVGGAPTVYVCRGQSCSAPVTIPDALGRLFRF